MKALLRRLGNSKVGLRALNSLSLPGGVYPTMTDAWAAARVYKHAGHDHPTAVENHLRLAEKPRPSDYPVLFWLSVLGGEGKRVFDFGGNVGNLYYCYKGYLAEPETIEWYVYDVAPVLARGREIARERQEDRITFTDNLADASACDVVLSSGSLHYWEESVSSLLGQFGSHPKHIFVNRCPLRTRGPQFATIQESDKYCVPCIVRNVDELIEEFAVHEYELVDRWVVEELSVDMPFHPDHTIPAYTGLYFKRRD